MTYTQALTILYSWFGLAFTLYEIVRMPTHFFALRRFEALLFVACTAAAWPLFWLYFYWQLFRNRPRNIQRRRGDWQ